jgi:Tol biopolymer transport system component
MGCSKVDRHHHDVKFDVSPDGKRVVFSSADGDLYLFDLSSKEADQLTKTKMVESSPMFAPDGKSIVYTAMETPAQGAQIYSMSLDRKTSIQLTKDEGVSDFAPSISSDGSLIAFARAHRYRPYSMGGWTWDDWDLYAMKRDGSELRRVTQKKHRGIDRTSFSRNGRAVIYSADADRQSEKLNLTIFELNLDSGRAPKALTAPPGDSKRYGTWASQPLVARDGTAVTFVSDRIKPFHYDVFVMKLDGGEAKPLGVTSVSQYNQQPIITPGGKAVLFLESNDTDSSSLWQVDIEGKNPDCIADSSLFTNPSKWLRKE